MPRARPGPEQRVDHAGRAGEFDGSRRQDLAGEPPRGLGRVAGQRPAPAEETERDRKAALAQGARGDEAVPAIVAGAAQNDDPFARAREPRRLVRDRESGRLHKDGTRRPAGDRHPVGLAHLGRGQELRVFQGIEHATKVAPRPGAGKREKRLGAARKSAIRAPADPR